MSHAMNAEACKTLERLGYQWKSLDGRHWDWYGPAVKESLTGERALAEYAYSVTAHDFERNPIGSRDWTLFWSGWQRNNEARNEAAPVSPAAQADVQEIFPGTSEALNNISVFPSEGQS